MEHGKRGYWEFYADGEGNNVISRGRGRGDGRGGSRRKSERRAAMASRERKQHRRRTIYFLDMDRETGRRSSESRHARMRTRKRILAGITVAALAVACVLIISKIVAPYMAPDAGGGAGSSEPGGMPLGAGATIGSAGGSNSNADLDMTVLVNAWNPLPKDYRPAVITDLMEIVAVSDISVRAAGEVVQPLTDMLNSAEDAGHAGLFVTSGYRNYDEQQRIYKESADKSYVQPPGCSEHQTGLAVDIMKMGVNMESFGDDPASDWLYENSWRYGFIVRYPRDKSDITGISYEPWHFRYVGKEVAKLCYEKNICLEEYAEDK